MNEQNQLNDRTFKKYQQLIYNEVGINLADHKKTLVQSRLRKWLGKYGVSTYEDLYKMIEDDKTDQMLIMLVNAITTNVTSFFREENQWLYLKNKLFEIVDQKQKRIRIWSAACSSGQEPYTIMIFLHENIPDFDMWDIKILATDISEEILQKAIKGEYTQKDVEGLPKGMIKKYFIESFNEKGIKIYSIIDELKKHITFRIFNLVTGDFKIFKNKFDMIFCRNVMIYFDRATQSTLLEHYAKLLDKHSRLFIGHSESIHNKNETYKMVIPSIYQIR
ncbi:protein-glutamate O-methyltransferase CheR [Sulfurimonas sp.]|uniref:CheR family methyltransferase n=1 Tax=Sulfurimonas sp. TaxID=2022749 RepID=UPI003564C095